MLLSLDWHRLALMLAWVATGLGSACGNPPDDVSSQAVEQRLVGTWLREYDEDGVKIRRILVLQAGGHFVELARIDGGDVPAAGHSHAGVWLFDGTNLKRHYTIVDGRQPSAPAMPYATFELSFPSRNEFVGIDRVRGREVAYHRVADGTQP